jgi:predicted nucleic acid-binding protein
MSFMIAVDTNVLIYARDPRDPRRQRVAADILRTLDDGVLLWQVACEYVAASRKLAAYGFGVSDALADLRDLRADWTTVLPDWGTLDRAETHRPAANHDPIVPRFVMMAVLRGVARGSCARKRQPP